MKRYVEQLLEDIGIARELASERLQKLVMQASNDEYFVLCEDEETGVTLSELFGLEQFSFPKRSYLDQKEVTTLVDNITSLWKAYGLNPLFPATLPVEMKYCQMRSYLHQKVYPMLGGLVDVELCDYLPSQCPLAADCPLIQLQLSKACCEIRA
jgi:hypothetical protein